MTVVRAADAPVFEVQGGAIIGGASPSRGATETCVWRVELAPGSGVPAHILDREEIFHALSGELVAIVDNHEHRVQAGDTLIVQPGSTLQIHVSTDRPFKAVVALPAGAQARFAGGGERFTPPWAV